MAVRTLRPVIPYHTMATQRRRASKKQLPREDETMAVQFDPQRVLLRRVFFLNNDKTRYLSVGFYPARNYLPHVEMGGARIKPIILDDHQVRTLATHLPILCSEMCNAGVYNVKDGNFTIKTTKTYNVARIRLDKQGINFHLGDLRYASGLMYVVQHQLDAYIAALQDVMAYVTSALSSTVFLQPTPKQSALGVIDYPLLFQELKAHV